MTLKEFFEKQAEGINFDTTRDDFTAMIGASAMSEIEIPDAFVNLHSGNMISFEDAKENPGIKMHFKNQLKATYLGVVDDTLKKVLDSDVFTEDEKEKIMEGENSKTRFSTLASMLEEKANAEPSTGSNEEQEKALKSARKQIKELNSQVLEMKDAHINEIQAKEIEFENRSIKNDLILDITGRKLAENIPGGKERAINAIAEEVLSNDKYIIKRKADNSLGLFLKDDSEIEYHEDNKVVELKTVLDNKTEPFIVKSGGNVIDGDNKTTTPTTTPTPITSQDGSLESVQKANATSALDDVLGQMKQ